MKTSILRKTTVVKAVIALLMVLVMPLGAQAQTMAIRSAIVAPGDTVTVPIEISGDVQRICGFQMDLTVTPLAGAPSLTISSITKAAAVTIAQVWPRRRGPRPRNQAYTRYCC